MYEIALTVCFVQGLAIILLIRRISMLEKQHLQKQLDKAINVLKLMEKVDHQRREEKYFTRGVDNEVKT